MQTNDHRNCGMPSISVIIPTYNRVDYLSQALKSVFDQSLRPFEVIVVDDGSNDGTADMVLAWRPEVRYFWQNHKGVSAARNRGLDEARGQVIAWLDSDDLWERGFLSATVSMLAAEPELDCVYTGLVRIDSEGSLLPQSSHKVVHPAQLYDSLVEHCNIQTSTFVARRECFEQAGRFDTNFDICEDYDMFLRLAKVCRIAGIPHPLIRYRVHAQNTVSDPGAFCRFRLALTEKHFGKPEGDPETWPHEKRRAHAYAFIAAALKCIENAKPETGWQYMEYAFLTWPGLADRVDTFYELICGDQPGGYRGHVAKLDIEGNGAKMLDWLEGLFLCTKPALDPMRCRAFGNAHLALAMLHDQAGDWDAARRHLVEGVRSSPGLLASRPVLRRLLKLFAGQRVAGLYHRVRRLR